MTNLYDATIALAVVLGCVGAIFAVIYWFVSRKIFEHQDRIDELEERIDLEVAKKMCDLFSLMIAVMIIWPIPREIGLGFRSNDLFVPFLLGSAALQYVLKKSLWKKFVSE